MNSMKWIKCSERLPKIQEEVEITNGYTILKSWIWDRYDGGVYFEMVEDDIEDVFPIWWRPLKGSSIETDFENCTFIPKPPKE